MYASNMVLGMLFAKARNVRRKDIFLDGVLAGSVKSPAAAFVLVAALSPRQGRGSYAPAITISAIDPDGKDAQNPVRGGTQLTISGSNFGAVNDLVIVNFSYISPGGKTRFFTSPNGNVVAAAAAGASPTISVPTPNMPVIAGVPANVAVSVTVGAQTSNAYTISYTP